MRAVITRVNEASVTIGGQETARIGKGFLVLLGVHVSDTEAEADRIVDRICGLRVFEDEAGKMNVNPTDAGAELLIVSQFTLFADCRSRRPGFTAAARPETAVPLYERVIAGCPDPRLHGAHGRVRRGHASRVRQRRPRYHPARYRSIIKEATPCSSNVCPSGTS